MKEEGTFILLGKGSCFLFAGLAQALHFQSNYSTRQSAASEMVPFHTVNGIGFRTTSTLNKMLIAHRKQVWAGRMRNWNLLLNLLVFQTQGSGSCCFPFEHGSFKMLHPTCNLQWYHLATDKLHQVFAVCFCLKVHLRAAGFYCIPQSKSIPHKDWPVIFFLVFSVPGLTL